MNLVGTILTTDIEKIIWRDSLQPLSENEVHVHCFPLNTSQEEWGLYKDLLSRVEKEKADRFLNPADRHRFIGGRIIVRLLLAQYNNCRPEEILITAGYHNKPIASRNTPATLIVNEFNISHSGNLLLIAVSDSKTGIDVEQLTDFDYNAVLRAAFSRDETACVKRHKNPRDMFYRLWTRKEALLKASGEGVIDNLAQLEVHKQKNETGLSFFNDLAYTILSFMPGEAYLGSVCYGSSTHKKVIFFKIPPENV